MKVCEIFTSIQGESSHAGRLCTFIRMTGCNLGCSYCDTTYAYDEGVEYTLDEIMKEISMRAVSLVEITGGEPLLQVESIELIKRLLDEGYEVLVETNGSVPIKDIDRRATVILDIKTPGSTMAEKMELDNLEHLKPTDEVKFVLNDRADYEWARDFIHEYSLQDKCSVLMSPVFKVLEAEKLSAWIIEDRLNVRLNLQLHKYIFGPDRRSV
jgi:7-carboxy-7-deazaguanine synthase